MKRECGPSLTAAPHLVLSFYLLCKQKAPVLLIAPCEAHLFLPGAKARCEDAWRTKTRPCQATCWQPGEEATTISYVSKK